MRSVHVGLIFSNNAFGDPDELASEALALADCLDGNGVAQGQHFWVLPAVAIGLPTAGCRAFRDRVVERTESVAVSGLTGAPDQLLRVDEIRSHLAWAASNSWKSGANDQTAALPWFILLPYADVGRDEAVELYREMDVPIALRASLRGGTVLTTPDHRLRLPVAELHPTESDATRFSARCMESDVRRVVTATARTAGSGPAVLLLHAIRGKPELTAKWVHSALRATKRPQAARLEALFAPPTTPPDNAVNKSIAGSNADRHQSREAPLLPGSLFQPSYAGLQLVGTLRAKRKSQTGTRRILEAAAGITAPNDLPARTTRTRIADITATLNGEASIVTDECVIQTSAGRFAGLWPGVEHAGRPRPAESLLIAVDGRREKAVLGTAGGCVGFESAQGRGAFASVELGDNKKHGAAAISYTALLEEPYMLICQSVMMPTDGALLLMHGLPIRDVPWRVRAEFADGTTTIVETGSDDRTVWGERLELRVGPMVASLCAVGPDGAVTPWSITVRNKPEPRLYVGPQSMVTGEPEIRTSSLVLTPAGFESEAANRIAGRRLPPSVREEALIGRQMTINALAGPPEA